MTELKFVQILRSNLTNPVPGSLFITLSFFFSPRNLPLHERLHLWVFDVVQSLVCFRQGGGRVAGQSGALEQRFGSAAAGVRVDFGRVDLVEVGAEGVGKVGKVEILALPGKTKTSLISGMKNSMLRLSS